MKGIENKIIYKEKQTIWYVQQSWDHTNHQVFYRSPRQHEQVYAMKMDCGHCLHR